LIFDFKFAIGPKKVLLAKSAKIKKITRKLNQFSGWVFNNFGLED